MTKDERLLQHLRLIAEDMPRVGLPRIAAAVVHRKEIVGLGVCSRKSDPLQKLYGKCDESIFLHAEISAIKNSIKRMNGMNFLKSSTLYIARRKIVGGQFVDGLCKPCCGCQGAINAFDIRRVVYTVND